MRYELINAFRVLLGEQHLKFSYSQFGEDRIIPQIFGKHQKGTYLDIGAHHPRRYSNTFMLYRRGWRGVNVDPSARAIRAFRRDRPRDVNIQAAVAAESGTVSVYDFPDHAFNTLSADQARQTGRPHTVKTVRAITVPEIFAESGLDPAAVDFLNIDVEGLDLVVLRQFDFSHFRPRCICVEIHGLDLQNPADNPTVKFMLHNGYKLHSYLLVSAIFIRRD